MLNKIYNSERRTSNTVKSSQFFWCFRTIKAVAKRFDPLPNCLPEETASITVNPLEIKRKWIEIYTNTGALNTATSNVSDGEDTNRTTVLGVRSGRCWQSHFSPEMRWGDRILLPSSSFRSTGLLKSQSGRPTSSSLTYLPGMLETARRSALLLGRWCAVAPLQVHNK